MRVSSETCRAVRRNIIKLYIVASRWTVIDIDTVPLFYEHNTVLIFESYLKKIKVKEIESVSTLCF